MLTPAMIEYANSPTKETQAALTPDDVLTILKLGNERFVAGQMTERDLWAQAKATSTGQYPIAAVLSCIDSRVPPELVFDVGIGDIFVGRVAGNFVNPDLLGSFEFATQVIGAKLILVLGHTGCGAVDGACDGLRLGNLTQTLRKLEPAIEAVPDSAGPRDSRNRAFVKAVTWKNVELAAEAFHSQSQVIRELVEAGELKIVGGVYELATGKVEFLDAGEE